MKSILKYFLIVMVALLLLPVAIVAFWIYATVKIIKYLLGEKDNYSSIGEYFKNTKNIVASVLAVVCLVFVPIGLVDFTKDFIENEKVRQAQESIEKKEEQDELAQKKYESERNDVLSPKHRIPWEIDGVESVDETCILSEEEIEKYNITDEEIAKFEKDREIAIAEYKDNKLIKEFEQKAKEYIYENTTSSVNRVYRYDNSEEYGFNEDKSIVTISGYYRGRTLQLVYIRGDYTVSFDAKTGEVIDGKLGKETVDPRKHPRK